MIGYTFTLNCPACGNLCTHRADGGLTPTGTCALAECDSCDWQGRIDVRLTTLRQARLNTRPESDVRHGRQPESEFGRALVAAFGVA